MSIEIQPDDWCPHILAGEAESVGGVHFPTEEPKAVSMALCQQCMDLALKTLENPIPINADAVEMLNGNILDAEYVSEAEINDEPS